jgi:hypothetical protein
MEMIGFDMAPAQCSGDRLADLAFAGTTDSHDHERGTGRQCGRLLLHGNSMGTIEWAAHCLSRMLALSKSFDKPPFHHSLWRIFSTLPALPLPGLQWRAGA